jgi:parallel beta-helix repeat protein
LGNIYYYSEGHVEGDKMNKSVHMLFILAVVLSGFAGVLTITPSSTGEYTPHDPIRIKGDADFAAQAANESWLGDGTEGNPYIIEGYEINATIASGIVIKFTNVHFIIRDSRIIDGGYSCFGIYLYHVTNGIIENCTLENNNRGIYMYESNGDKITNNAFISNRNGDIDMTYSYSNNISGNTMTEHGIDIRGRLLEHWNTTKFVHPIQSMVNQFAT